MSFASCTVVVVRIVLMLMAIIVVFGRIMGDVSAVMVDLIQMVPLLLTMVLGSVVVVIVAITEVAAMTGAVMIVPDM